MAKIRVIGTSTVGGIAPGKSGVLDLPEPNLAALVKGGHIVLVVDRPPPEPQPDAPQKATAEKGDEA